MEIIRISLFVVKLTHNVLRNTKKEILTSLFSLANASWPCPSNDPANFFPVLWHATRMKSTRLSAACRSSDNTSVFPALQKLRKT